MRGNEYANDPPLFDGRRAFPIPMRGNETAKLDATLPADVFPIPMRGNEPMDVDTGQADLEKFPIPMRGNESPRSCGHCGSALVFPIPMRGNELVPSNIASIAGVFPIPMRGDENVDDLNSDGAPIGFRSP